MSRARIFAAVLAVMLMSTTLWGCGKHHRHSAYDQPPAGEIKIKGQVDGGVESSGGFGGKND